MPAATRRSPSCHAARPVSSWSQRARSRNASRNTPLSVPAALPVPRSGVSASGGSSVHAPTLGLVSASTIGLRVRISSSESPSCRASESTRSATEAPVSRLPPVSVSIPIRISCACTARSTDWLRWMSAMIWRLDSSRIGGTASRSASTRSSRFSASRGSADRSRPTRHAPWSRRAAGIGLRRWSSDGLGRMSPASRRSMPT